MAQKILKHVFELLIGNISEEKKAELRKQFRELLVAVARASVEGAVAGAIKK